MSNVQLDDVKCGCGENEWVQVVSFGMVPAVLSENGKAGLAPVKQIFVCMKCGKSIEESKAFQKMNEEPKSSIITK